MLGRLQVPWRLVKRKRAKCTQGACALVAHATTTKRPDPHGAHTGRCDQRAGCTRMSHDERTGTSRRREPATCAPRMRTTQRSERHGNAKVNGCRLSPCVGKGVWVVRVPARPVSFSVSQVVGEESGSGQ
eukprot:7254895-Prymnesium_polylepis.1